MLLLIGVVVLGRVREFLFDDFGYGLGPALDAGGEGDGWLGRADWDRIWSGRARRRLEPSCPLASGFDPADFGLVRGATIARIAADAPGHGPGRPAGSLCAVCGEPTASRPWHAADLDLHFEGGGHLGVCSWVHPDCYDQLPEAGPAETFPW